MRLLREAAELTRTELGRRIGVSERQIYDWENGIKLPRIDTSVALAREIEDTIGDRQNRSYYPQVGGVYINLQSDR